MPRLFKDGNQWCVLHGENLQEGIAGFGSTKDEAWEAFFKERKRAEQRVLKKIDAYLAKRGFGTYDAVDDFGTLVQRQLGEADDVDDAHDFDVDELCDYLELEAAEAAPGQVRVEYDRPE